MARLAIDESVLEQMLRDTQAFQQAMQLESEQLTTALEEKKVIVEVVTEEGNEVEDEVGSAVTEIEIYQTVSQETLSNKIDKYISEEHRVKVSAEKVLVPKDLLYHYLTNTGADLTNEALDNRQYIVYSKPLRRPLKLDNGSIRLVTEKATNRKDMVLGGTVVSGRYGNNQKQNTDLLGFYPNEVLSLEDREGEVHTVITSQALKTYGSSIELITVFVPYEYFELDDGSKKDSKKLRISGMECFDKKQHFCISGIHKILVGNFSITKKSEGGYAVVNQMATVKYKGIPYDKYRIHFKKDYPITSCYAICVAGKYIGVSPKAIKGTEINTEYIYYQKNVPLIHPVLNSRVCVASHNRDVATGFVYKSRVDSENIQDTPYVKSTKTNIGELACTDVVSGVKLTPEKLLDSDRIDTPHYIFIKQGNIYATPWKISKVKTVDIIASRLVNLSEKESERGLYYNKSKVNFQVLTELELEKWVLDFLFKNLGSKFSNGFVTRVGQLKVVAPSRYEWQIIRYDGSKFGPNFILGDALLKAKAAAIETFDELVSFLKKRGLLVTYHDTRSIVHIKYPGTNRVSEYEISRLKSDPKDTVAKYPYFFNQKYKSFDKPLKKLLNQDSNSTLGKCGVGDVLTVPKRIVKVNKEGEVVMETNTVYSYGLNKCFETLKALLLSLSPFIYHSDNTMFSPDDVQRLLKYFVDTKQVKDIHHFFDNDCRGYRNKYLLEGYKDLPKDFKGKLTHPLNNMVPMPFYRDIKNKNTSRYLATDKAGVRFSLYWNTVEERVTEAFEDSNCSFNPSTPSTVESYSPIPIYEYGCSIYKVLQNAWEKVVQEDVFSIKGRTPYITFIWGRLPISVHQDTEAKILTSSQRSGLELEQIKKAVNTQSDIYALSQYEISFYKEYAVKPLEDVL